MKKFLLLFIVSFFLSFAFSDVPSEYYPNYKIAGDWNDILKIFKTIEAQKNIGQKPDSSLFPSLNTKLKAVSKYLPKEPDYQLVYEQCILSTEKLKTSTKYEDYLIFKDRCFEPLNEIMKQIDKKYTVIPKIKANPISGPAPLTVTFDARGSVDPSNDTIPADNYFWYFKDASGNDRIIGKGAVLNYTFNQPGSYVVHLTVRSVNNLEKGILDGESSITINVGPKAAVISVYINGKRMSEDTKTKVGTQEAKKGVLIDGSGTQPTGGRKIIKYEWEITGEGGFSYKKSGSGNPGAFRLSFPGNGEYKVKLTIIDNEENKISGEYQLIVSDPIATIKPSANQGDTSNTYTFDASLSYSIQSKIKKYKWAIYDPNGNQIETLETKKFQKRFLLPGNYSIKLSVVDELDNTNDDQLSFYVESTPPIAQFIVTPVKGWKEPSQFILDAGASTDIDVTNGYDELKYEWKVSNDQYVKIEKVYDEGMKALVSFNQPGNYKIKLIVTDKYGKISEVEKEFNIKSTLRPEVIVNPTVSIWGNPMSFFVKSNKTISYYEWNFGDNSSSSTSKNSITHTYKSSGVFPVSLKVKSQSGEENEVYLNAFVGERDSPVAYYEFKMADKILSEDEICSFKESGKTIDKKAFGVDRNESFTIDASKSVNGKGKTDGLKIFFQAQNDEAVQNQQLQYKFDEMGCQKVILTVEDTVTGKTDQKEIFIKVKNALPKLQNLEIFFPQYGNESGIGFNQNNKKQDMFKVQYDPLIVKVVANGAKDTDGMISHFMWYYYEAKNPSKIIELKITPANVNYGIFSVPRIPGEFIFGVKIVDNDGGEISNEDIIGKGPSVYFPPDTKNLDIPQVSLSTDRVNANVGEEVTFRVKAIILSNRSDFFSNRTIKYDFDGDGEYDLTTKKDTVKYTYKLPGNYKPKAKVIYRGYGGVGYGDNIEVKNGLKVNILYDTFGKKVIFRDISFGEVEKRQFCMDSNKCNMKSYNINEKTYFEFDYPQYGSFVVKATISDKYGNEDKKLIKIKLSSGNIQKPYHIMSIPNISKDSKSIQVGNNMGNSVLFYIVSKSDEGDCFLDYDINTDTNGDGILDNDNDLLCNALGLKEYSPKAMSTTARVYNKGKHEDIKIEFIDFDTNLSPNLQKVYNDLDKIISEIGTGDSKVSYLNTLLINLQYALGDKAETDALVVQINDYIADNAGDNIFEEIKKKLEPIFDVLMDKSLKGAMGGTPYDVAKIDILNLVKDGDINKKLIGIFDEIEKAQGNKDFIKNKCQEILSVVEQLGKDGGIDELTMNVIKNDVCEIIKYYEIPSATCGTGKEEPKPKTSKSGIFWTIIKVLGIIVGILAVIFIVLIVIFAIKAKKNQAQQEQNNKS